MTNDIQKIEKETFTKKIELYDKTYIKNLERAKYIIDVILKSSDCIKEIKPLNKELLTDEYRKDTMQDIFSKKKEGFYCNEEHRIMQYMEGAEVGEWHAKYLNFCWIYAGEFDDEINEGLYEIDKEKLRDRSIWFTPLRVTIEKFVNGDRICCLVGINYER